jgi:hypothetical protein
MEAPLCHDAAELAALDGRQVRLLGRYLAVPTLKTMPRPGQPRDEVDLGEVVIEVTGEAGPMRVHLGTGFRPRDEIERFNDRRVVVPGRLTLNPEPAVDVAGEQPAPTLLDPGEPRLAE